MINCKQAGDVMAMQARKEQARMATSLGTTDSTDHAF